jgi:hypothetical protein
MNIFYENIPSCNPASQLMDNLSCRSGSRTTITVEFVIKQFCTMDIHRYLVMYVFEQSLIKFHPWQQWERLSAFWEDKFIKKELLKMVRLFSVTKYHLCNNVCSSSFRFDVEFTRTFCIFTAPLDETIF